MFLVAGLYLRLANFCEEEGASLPNQTLRTNSDLSFIAPMPSILQSMS